MKNKIIKLGDFLINSLPLIGFILVLLAMVFQVLFVKFMWAAIAVHFINEGVKAIKEKNKWKDNVAFMEYMLKAAGYNLKE